MYVHIYLGFYIYTCLNETKKGGETSKSKILRILACLPSGSTDVTASASWHITKPSRIPILSPVLFMRVGDSYIPLFKFEEFLIYL